MHPVMSTIFSFLSTASYPCFPAFGKLSTYVFIPCRRGSFFTIFAQPLSFSPHRFTVL